MYACICMYVCMHAYYVCMCVRPQCWGLLSGVLLKDYLNTPKLLGKWIQAEPSGCATKCGVAAGKSGNPGAVTCDSLSCDPDTKPDAKQCPETDKCGTFGTDMSIVHRHSNHLLLLHRHHSQLSQAPHRSTPHMLARLFECNGGSLVKVFC